MGLWMSLHRWTIRSLVTALALIGLLPIASVDASPARHPAEHRHLGRFGHRHAVRRLPSPAPLSQVGIAPEEQPFGYGSSFDGIGPGSSFGTTFDVLRGF